MSDYVIPPEDVTVCPNRCCVNPVVKGQPHECHIVTYEIWLGACECGDPDCQGDADE